MKARVKATGIVLDVYLSHIIRDNVKEIIWYKTPQGACFTKDELEFIDTENNFDYWTCLEHQAAIGAMHGLCANYTEFTKDNDGTLSNTEMITENARIIAHVLVEQLKEKEERK